MHYTTPTIDRPPQGFHECAETGQWVHHSDLTAHRAECAACRKENGDE